jgi:MFS family permease
MRNRERPVYFGVIGMTWAFASAIGPLLGGVLTSKASWKWCFYINRKQGNVSTGCYGSDYHLQFLLLSSVRL